MAKQTINIGAAPNDGTGTPLRTAFDYCNLNFTELYTATGPSGNNIVVPGTATITGDLTVATSALKVTGGKVGIGTASPAYELDVSSATASNQLRISGSNQNSITFANAAAGASNGFLVGRSFASDDANNLFFFDIASSALRLFVGNTGNVGIATAAPSYRLSVNASNPTSGNIAQFYNDATSSLNGAFCLITQFGVQDWYMGQPAGVSAFTIGTGTTSKSEFFRINGSGNVGIGVTPSAWNNSYNVIEIGQNGSISGRTSTNNQVDIVSNGYRESGGSWLYKLATSNAAARYLVDGSVGAHLWYSGVAGTAGNTIAGFSTASMTLDANGNLIVNGTNSFAKISSYVTSSGTFQSALGATNGSNSDFVVRVKTSVSDVYNSVGNLTFSTGGSGGTERVRIKDTGQVRFVPLASDPAGAEAGDVYYNSSSNKLKCYNGTTWNDLF
jgi:hypothetical protein